MRDITPQQKTAFDPTPGREVVSCPRNTFHNFSRFYKTLNLYSWYALFKLILRHDNRAEGNSDRRGSVAEGRTFSKPGAYPREQRQGMPMSTLVYTKIVHLYAFVHRPLSLILSHEVISCVFKELYDSG